MAPPPLRSKDRPEQKPDASKLNEATIDVSESLGKMTQQELRDIHDTLVPKPATATPLLQHYGKDVLESD